MADLRAHYPAVAAAAAAAAVPAGGGQAAMQALFQPKHCGELANLLMRAKRRRFALDNVALMQAAAGGAA
jgi:hypothetical protein